MNFNITKNGRVEIILGPLYCKLNCKSAYHNKRYSLIYWNSTRIFTW